jgi:hypothetical protein
MYLRGIKFWFILALRTLHIVQVESLGIVYDFCKEQELNRRLVFVMEENYVLFHVRINL